MATRTYAILTVPNTIYAAVHALLMRAAGEVRTGSSGEIQMDGIALARQTDDGNTERMVEVGTLLSARNGRGRVEMQIGGEVAQWDIGDAKKIHAMLGEAIEAAISDELIYTFLTTKVGIFPEQASQLLVDFRELRQGSKGTVNPS